MITSDAKKIKFEVNNDDNEYEPYEPTGDIDNDLPAYVPSLNLDTTHGSESLDGSEKDPSTSYSDVDDEEPDSEDDAQGPYRTDYNFDPATLVGDKRKKKKEGLTGVAGIVKKLRHQMQPDEKPIKDRIVLTATGDIIRRRNLPKCKIGQVVQKVALGDGQEPCDLPPPPPHPTEVNAVRRLIRSKMIRCKRCKNRFVEKNLYERHLRDRHPKEYEEYIAEQEAEMDAQRLEELEANRIEELQTGGFIPPAEDIQSSNFKIEVDGIPLPGENNGGVAPRFDSFGGLKSVRRPYKKKVSPQCPFCDKRFRNEYSLKKHFVKKHPDHLDFVQCTKCFKCCRDPEELAEHDCELTYVCFECTPIRNLVSDQRLLGHRRKFHRGANSGFRCNECNLKFLTPRKLRKHKKMSHVFTHTFQCHFCEEMFVSEVSVMTHERIHTGIIKFECRICDFKCNRYVQMEDHNVNEHGYICAICKLKHAEWGKLKQHTLEDHGGYLTEESRTGYIESPRVWVMFKGE